MNTELALSWGPSFAQLQTPSEVTRLATSQVTPITTLKNGLGQWPSPRLRISLGVIKKILRTRLGNSVAQVVTSGFEKWVELRQNADSEHFVLSPKRADPLGNPDLVFGVKERTLADGTIAQSVDPDELLQLARALKDRGLERICLNFLNSYQNPTNLKMAEKIFGELGLEVFSRSHPSPPRDELSVWRRNILDACLASFIHKIQEDFANHLPELPYQVFDTECGFRELSVQNGSGLLFSRERALQHSELPVLYFGPEEWVWISPENESQWQSPWGAIDLQKPKFGSFAIQPGRELLIDKLGDLALGEDHSMDPGPIVWGRANRLTVYDLLLWPLETSPALRRSTKSELRAQEVLRGMLKHSQTLAETSLESLANELVSLIAEQCLVEVAPSLTGNQIIVAGEWADALLPALEKLKPEWTFLNHRNLSLETNGFWSPR